MKNKLLSDFKITSKAKRRIEEIKVDNKDVFIRIMVTEGGCAGHQYHILMDDYIGETDFVLKQKNKKEEELVYVVIDKSSLEYLRGGELDFLDDLNFSGFKIKNPNAKTTCNCGNSFNCNSIILKNKKKCKTNYQRQQH